MLNFCALRKRRNGTTQSIARSEKIQGKNLEKERERKKKNKLMEIRNTHTRREGGREERIGIGRKPTKENRKLN